jgi:hypothetical protein
LPTLTKTELSLRASAAANWRWAKEPDRSAATAPARAAAESKLNQRLLDELGVDISSMSDDQLERCLKSARRSYFQRLALRRSRLRHAGEDGATS